MKIKRVLFISFLLSILVYSCSKDEDNQNELANYSNDIKGEWEWVQSSGGFSGKIITPQTQGYTSSLKIKKDSMFTYNDDTLAYEHEYILVKIGTSHEIDSLRVVYSKDPLTDTISGWIDFAYSIYKDTLRLDPVNIADYQSSTYVRK